MKNVVTLLLAAVLAATPLLCLADAPLKLEAEKAVLGGSNRVITEAAASGFKAVGKFENTGDHIDFAVEIEKGGMYDLTIVCKSTGGSKTNNILVDGVQQGTFETASLSYKSSVLKAVPLSAGPHTISITASWGWIQVDYIQLTPAETLDAAVFNVTAELIDPAATPEARGLYAYLKECYGKVTLAGQVCDGGLEGAECRAIHDVTGKYPAMLGFDMMDHTPYRISRGARGTATQKAIRFHEQGGIVTFCWHWSCPGPYILDGKDENGNPRWWGGFYTRNSTFDVDAVMNGRDPAGFEALNADIAAIAAELKKLQDAGVPVLWRPLHEASGGWFWWGAKGAEPYKQLWIHLYEQLTQVHGCHNLIWVWNGQHADWYPGDQYVDIIGEDIYAPEHNYAPQHAKFAELTGYAETPHIVALTENGVVFDIDQAVEAGTKWAWFNTWSGDFVLKNGRYSEVYTEADILRKAYDSEYVITLDELPKDRW